MHGFFQTETSRGTLAALVFLGSASAWTAGAQDIRYGTQGLEGFDTLGLSLAVVGDWDGDGFQDWAASTGVTSPFHPVGGYVRVFSGSQGAILHTFTVPPHGQPTWYGRLVAAVGDVDNDGIEDLAIGGNNSTVLQSGYVEIRSGADGSLLHTLINPAAGGNYGYSVDRAGDLNDDGHADVLIGTPYAPNGGLVDVRSGADGSTLLSLAGIGTDWLFGARVLHLGDVTGDGIDDYLVSAPAVFDSRRTIGEVRVYSGADGSLFYRLTTGFEGFAAWVERAGDVDGDGREDYFVTQSYEFGDHPDVLLYSGDTAQLIARVEHPTPVGWLGSGFGYRISEASGVLPGVGGPVFAFGDSGYPEPVAGCGQVLFMNVLTGEVLASIHETDSSVNLGMNLLALDDLDGDGYREMLVASRSALRPDNRGHVAAYDMEAGGITRYCTGAPNSYSPDGARIYAGTSTSITDDVLGLNTAGVVLNQTSVYIASPGTAMTPFGDGWRCVGSPVFRIAYPGPSSASAGAPVSLDLPVLASGAVVIQPGSTWHFQLYYRDPGGPSGFNLSDALAVTFGP